jgi:ubiquitin C-terminal hydrolase
MLKSSSSHSSVEITSEKNINKDRFMSPIEDRNKMSRKLPSTGSVEMEKHSLPEMMNKVKINFNEPLNIRPRGLINRENTCFLNAILQPLIFCPPFVSLIRQFDEDMIKNSNIHSPLLLAMIQFIKEFEEKDSVSIQQSKPLTQKKKKQSDAFFPKDLWTALQKLRTISNGHQEDAQEFLGLILDTLHEEFSSIIKSVDFSYEELSEAFGQSKISSSDDDSEWIEVGPKKKLSSTREVRKSNMYII